MVSKLFVFTGTEEKAKCVGPKTRFILCTAGSIPGAKADQLAKPRGPCYIGRDEPIETKIENASMFRLRKVVLGSEQSGDSHV